MPSKYNPMIVFQTNAGIPVSSFLELVTLYQTLTAVSFNGQLFIHSKGACSAPSIAPKLSKTYLSV